MASGEWTQTERGLKILVIVMGVLIVAGLAVIGTTIAKRQAASGAPTGAPTGAVGTARAPGVPVATAFGEKNIELPKNGRLTGVHTESGRLILRILLPGNRESLIVLDIATGEKLGTVNVQSAP